MKCELNSAEGLEWLKIGNRNFGDFQNKLLDGIERLANSIKEHRTRLLSFFDFDVCLFYQKILITFIFY